MADKAQGRTWRFCETTAFWAWLVVVDKTQGQGLNSACITGLFSSPAQHTNLYKLCPSSGQECQIVPLGGSTNLYTQPSQYSTPEIVQICSLIMPDFGHMHLVCKNISHLHMNQPVVSHTTTR